MNLWILPSALAVALLLLLIVFVLRRPPPTSLRPSLLGTLGSAFLFASGDLLVSMSGDESGAWPALVLRYTGLMFVTPSGWMLLLRFAELQGHAFSFGRAAWTRAPFAWACLLWLMLVTNPWHGQFLSDSGGVEGAYNWGWWAYAVSGYALLGVVAIAYVSLLRRVSSSVVRQRFFLMLLASCATWVINVFYVLANQPLPFDPAAAGTCVASMLFVWGIYGTRLFALSPIAMNTVIRHGQDAILVIDREGLLLEANLMAEKLFGDEVRTVDVDIYRLLSRALRSPNEPDKSYTADEMRERLQRTPRGEAGQLYRLAGAAARWVRVRSVPLPSGGEDLAGYSIWVQEQTELQSTIDALERSESTLRLVLDHVPYHVFAKDREGRYVFVNRAMAEAAGMTAQEMLGRTPLETPANEADARQLMDQDRQLLENNEKVFVPDYTVTDYRGKERTFQITKTPVALPGREDISLLGVSVDITEIKAAERALQHAQKLESLGVMAGGIAHDFNNLLVAVLGNASLALTKVGPDSPAHAHLVDVDKAAQRGSELTRQLLAYAGKGRVLMEDVDLSQLVRDATDLIAVSIPSSISVRYDLAENLRAVHVDASQVQQIVMNLVINAAEAVGEEAAGEVVITTEEVELDADEVEETVGEEALPAGRYVMLSVRDSGCGMDAKTRARIFDPFFTTKFAGRGLGLAAVLGIVRGHQGSLRVESEAGVGSTFRVLLPATSAPAVQKPERLERMADGMPTGTILLVDDDASVLRIAARILESAGLGVLQAQDGVEALDVFERHRADIDAVLLDLTMPHKSGRETAQVLRMRDPVLPLILTSGYPEHDEVQRVAGEGFTSFVQKPYLPDALLELVREAIIAARSRAPSLEAESG
ncbi:MAG: PAS domain-containing protein [Proteobacteria bacterium]|nr:PAS domain-containing protein [Pseudomonadota bacterium]